MAETLQLPASINPIDLLVELAASCTDKPIVTLATLLGTAGSAVPISLGVYDFNRTFCDSNAQAIEHVFTSWRAYKPSAVYEALLQAQSPNRWLLLSLDPWADPEISPNSNSCSLMLQAGNTILSFWLFAKRLSPLITPSLSAGVMKWNYPVTLAATLGPGPILGPM